MKNLGIFGREEFSYTGNSKKRRGKNPKGGFVAFRVHGVSVQFAGQGGTVPLGWSNRADAFEWKTMRLARIALNTLSAKESMRGNFYGIASANTKPSQIVQAVADKLGKA